MPFKVRSLLPLGLLIASQFLPRECMAAKHYVGGCWIADEKLEVIRAYPGLFCAFLKDGSMVMAGGRGDFLSYTDAKGVVIWKRKVDVHHQMKLSHDQKKVLLLSSEVKPSEFYPALRYDVLLVLDLKTGRTLHRWAMQEHQPEFVSAFRKFGCYDPPWKEKRKHLGDSYIECSQANSFNEIPENPVAKRHGAFSAGNFVASFPLSQGIAILDKNLTRFLWTKRVEEEVDYHDVQVLPSGELMVYYNSSCSSPFGDRVLIDISDPLTGKSQWRLPQERGNFDAPHMGGVQALDGDRILFNVNDESVGGLALMVTRKGDVLWAMPNPFKNPSNQKPWFFQDIKETDLGDFLRNSKG
jgi:hypothetical protein